MVSVVCPAGAVGCGFADCGKQVGETPGVSAKTGAVAEIAARPTIGTLASAVNDTMMNLRIETPPRGDDSTLASAAVAIAPRTQRYQALQTHPRSPDSTNRRIYLGKERQILTLLCTRARKSAGKK